MTLTEFLLARIAEDEAGATAASRGPWTVDSEDYAEYIGDADGQAVISGGRWGGEASVFGDTSDALHIVRWDPVRVLAECAVKRAIMAYAIVEPWREPLILRTLAAPYADHPDFDASWVLAGVTREAGTSAIGNQP